MSVRPLSHAKEEPMCISTRSTCRICGEGNLKLLLDYGDMPLAGAFLPQGDIKLNEVYPLRLALCTKCKLMQILDTVSAERIFSRYSYASTTTKTLSDHFARMGPEIVKYAGADDKLVVEFGCNDGVLLRPLIASGAKVIGIDPSDVALRASQEQGWLLYQDYFNDVTAARVRVEHGLARIVTGNNVCAHVDDLHEIVRGVATLLEDEGLFIFEVHYQGDLLALVQYDTVYHEHICYYSLTSLSQLLGEHELKVIDVIRIPIHAGSIRVIAARKISRREVSPMVHEMLATEKKWDYDRFVRQVEVRRLTLKTLVEDLREAGKRVVAYGAAGRVTILLNYCGLDAGKIEYVVDMSPLRYGKMVPGVLVPIVPPEYFHNALPEYAIMTAWNYETEIIAKEQGFLSQGGHFIIPLPEVRLVGDV